MKEYIKPEVEMIHLISEMDLLSVSRATVEVDVDNDNTSDEWD